MTVNAFLKARERTEVLAAAKNESFGYFVGVGTEYEEIGEAVRMYCEETRKAKESLAKAETYERPIRELAERIWLQRMAHDGIPNAAPLKLVNADGTTVIYTVQDRTGSTSLEDRALEELRLAVGAEAVHAVLEERTTYSFDPKIMSRLVTLPGRRRARTIEQIVGERLTAMSDDLVVNGVLTADEAGALITASSKRTLRRGFLRELPVMCEYKVGRIAKAIAALGSAVVRYIKAG